MATPVYGERANVRLDVLTERAWRLLGDEPIALVRVFASEALATYPDVTAEQVADYVRASEEVKS